jgi:hypothetical protein
MTPLSNTNEEINVSIIKLEFSEDDVIAQKYLGEALVNMAYHRDTGEAVKMQRSGMYGSTDDKNSPLLDGEDITKVEIKPAELQLPWDERIHSGNKTQNQDGSWKKRKKPKDMTTEQWDEFVAEVEAELTTLMSIPVDEPNQYPIYWRHDGDDSVGVVHNDEEYNQLMINTPGCIVDQISEELFNKLSVNNPPADANDTTPQLDVSNTVLTVNSMEVTGMVEIPKPPVINQDDQPAPPPPPVTNVAPVGNTQDVVEGVKPMTFVQLVQRMSAKCNGDVTKSAKIKDAISNKYAIEFAALVKRPELIPQVGAFLDTIEV